MTPVAGKYVIISNMDNTIGLLLFALVLLFGLLVVFTIPALIEMRRTAKKTAEFMNAAEKTLLPALEELGGLLKNLRETTESINRMASDAREVTSALSEASKGVRGMAALLEDTSSKIRNNALGIKAGLRAAFEVLTRNILKGGGTR